MVIDTSAIVAVLFDEEDGPVFDRAIEAAPLRLISAVTRVEMACVVEGRKRVAVRAELDRFLAALALDIVPVSVQHATLAIEAFRSFGKGRHPAGLNIGDCFSYALARATGYPLLFKGQDFTRTDLRSALA